ncbi:MAG TPA: glycosyltransferase family 39 protein [Candidatus Paceibacterota bacterium]|nr:glycosyltransferase family 39 protein [Candidatus Paceibacterota bacterium]
MHTNTNRENTERGGFLDFFARYRYECALVLISVTSASLMAWYVSTKHLTTALADEVAHMIFARILIDSMTPGVSQLGTWPPLLHVVMAPFSLSDFLFRTGLMGAAALIPFFAMGSVFLYRLLLELSGRKILSFLGTLLYVFNPFVLYYASVPMTEILFMSMLFGTAYFFTLWMKYERLRYILLTALFVTLTCLSRYEGLLLIPVLVFMLWVQMYRKKKTYSESEALTVLYGVLAAVGMVLIVLNSWAFAGSPLAFAGIGNGEVWNLSINSDLTQHSVLSSVNFFLHASFYMLGKFFVPLSLFCAILAIALVKKKTIVAAAFVALLVPFAAVVSSLYRGSAAIYTPEFLSYVGFHNTRYGLTWIGFAVAAVTLMAVGVREYLAVHVRQKWVSVLVIPVFAIFVFTITGVHFYRTAFASNFSVIRDDLSATSRDQKNPVAVYLKEHYTGGKILATRFNHDYTLLDSDIPLKNYIYEGNFIYFDEVLGRPWLYTPWVIMTNPTSPDRVRAKDPVSDKWEGSVYFKNFYTMVYKTPETVLYQLKIPAVEKYIQENHLNEAYVPSLHPNMQTWDPKTIEQKMGLVNNK